MADFTLMIPFILHCEEGIPRKYLSLPPEQIFDRVGRKVHIDPADRGGYTRAGVILSTYAAWRRARGQTVTTVDHLRDMSYDEWREILKTMFWDRWQADLIESQKVAVALVDWVWCSGVNGIKHPQRLLGVKADGVAGPVTLAAVNAVGSPDAFFSSIQAARRAYHEAIAPPGSRNSRFLRGWNRRVSLLDSFFNV